MKKKNLRHCKMMHRHVLLQSRKQQEQRCQMTHCLCAARKWGEQQSVLLISNIEWDPHLAAVEGFGGAGGTLQAGIFSRWFTEDDERAGHSRGNRRSETHTQTHNTHTHTPKTLAAVSPLHL